MAAALCFENVKEQALQGLPGTDGQGLVGGGALAQNAHLNDENGSGLHMHPIHFLYGHLHNSIRTELDNLSNWVLALEADNEQDLQQRLQHLKERYHFLEQVYKYHSSVEDEVVYPALDSKVKNVTSAYSVEHQDEEYLFEHLGSLLGAAVTQTGAERTATIRELICKVAEIHITLRKHLAKEEAQLLPLLLQHFSAAEQAELVAQFLYCIPLDTVERVLSWLTPTVPLRELQVLMSHLRDVIPDRLLLQLLVTWLNPAPPAVPAAAAAAAAAPAAAGGAQVASADSTHAAAVAAAVAAADAGDRERLVICPFAAGAKKQQGLQAPAVAAADDLGVQQQQAAADVSQPAAGSVQQWPPLRAIVLFHHSIRGAMEVFASEAAALQQQQGVSACQLAGLVERHRFLRSVCMFHSQSEEEVMFPEVLKISSGAGGPQQKQVDTVLATCSTCQDEHTGEIALFEGLGRLLADVRAYVRRGRTRDVSGMLGKLVETTNRVSAAISTHMQREESEVLPLLAAALGSGEQRAIVWHTLRAMPLRLLERVLPWLFSELSDEDADGMMTNLRLGAPVVDQQLVELLLRWAQRGRWPVLPDIVVAAAAATATPAPAATVSEGPSNNASAGGAAPLHEQPQQEQQEQQQEQKLTSTEGVAPQGREAAVPAAVIDDLCTSCGVSVTLGAGSAACKAAGAACAAAGCGPAAAAAVAAGAAGCEQPAAADASQQQQQQQQQHGLTGQLRLHRQGSPSWASYDPCLFGNNTCELRLLNQSVSGLSPRKRQKLDRQGSPLDSSSTDATPTAGVAAAAAAAAGGGEASAASLVDLASTVSNTPGQLSDAAVHAALAGVGGHGGSSSSFLAHPAMLGGAADAANPTGCSPIDHIFQFHKALRRELKQLESDAAALELVVLGACEQHEQEQQQQQQQQGQQPKAPAQVQQAGVQPLPATTPAHMQQLPALGGAQQLTLFAGHSSVETGLASSGSGACLPVPAPTGCPAAAAVLVHCSHALQQLDGRFHFLWGIYRAHSKAEDEIVFPALESKEALHNVSRAYSLDHEQEEQLFHNLSAVLQRMRVAATVNEARDLALQLRRMCAAVRASLETHVRAEEAELWPLFSEHFSVQEQQHLVGVIIGRTGAEVLQALLPWVTGSFSAEEKEAMMDSLREATKNTMFDQWLDAVQTGNDNDNSSAGGDSNNSDGGAGTAAGPQPAAAAAAGAGAPNAAAGAAAAAQHQQQQLDTHMQLVEIAGYLAGSDPAAAAPEAGPLSAAATLQQQHHQAQLLLQQQMEVSGTVAESTNYVPGWEDIFNINQKQLEGAIRRVSNDPNLEPQRKAYLIQNIMVSRYIVAQQRRMQRDLSLELPGDPAAAAAAATAGGAGAGAGACAGAGCSHHTHHHHHHHHHVGHLLQHGHHHAHTHQRLAPVVHQQQLLQPPPVQPKLLQPAGSSAAPGAVVPPTTTATNSAAAAAGGDVQQCHQTYTDATSGILGCQHYRRSARLVAPCCGQVFTCRLCHDDACDHRLDRYAISEMVCMLCGVRQPVAGSCASCSTKLASYYCNICHLWDDEPGRAIYHCPFCNVCRRGQGLGVDFFHCMQCNACMSLSLFNTHTCRERAMEGNCPVCHEYLFDSATPIKELPCGHFLHSSCFAEYARYSYTCPICCKSIGDMSMYFQMLDSLLAAERHRLPAEYADKKQSVLCQDCGKVGMAAYHWVYHACPHCKSYNTRML